MGWLKKITSGLKKAVSYGRTAKTVYSTISPALPPRARFSSVYPVAPPPLAQGSRGARFPFGIHTISPQIKSIVGFGILALVAFFGLKKFKVI